jgi:hypothetical protein
MRDQLSSFQAKPADGVTDMKRSMVRRSITPTSADEHGRRLVPVKEFARLLSVSIWAARKWVYSGKIASVKLGSRLQIPVSEIDRIIEENLRPRQQTPLCEEDSLAPLAEGKKPCASDTKLDDAVQSIAIEG